MPFLEQAGFTGLFVNDSSGSYILDPNNDGNLVDGIALTSGGTIITQGFLNSTGFRVLGIEANSTGYGAILDGPLGYAYWLINPNGAIVSSGSLTDSQVLFSEFYFAQDLNGDGQFGPLGLSLSLVEEAGFVSLYSSPLGFFLFDPAQGSVGATLPITFNGQPVVADANGQYQGFRLIASEANTTGYGVILQNAATGAYAYWLLDPSGAITATGDLSNEAVTLSETYFGQDLDGNLVEGPFVPGTVNIEQSGDAFLYRNGSGFYLLDTTQGVVGATIKITFNGQPVLPDANGLYAGFRLIGVEPNSSGYGVILQNTTTGAYAFWIVDPNGAITQTGDLTTSEVIASEGVFSQDLNGDGVISGTTSLAADSLVAPEAGAIAASPTPFPDSSSFVWEAHQTTALGVSSGIMDAFLAAGEPFGEPALAGAPDFLAG